MEIVLFTYNLTVACCCHYKGLEPSTLIAFHIPTKSASRYELHFSVEKQVQRVMKIVTCVPIVLL